MAINQLSTANTFQEWLITTSALVSVANNLTDNTNGGFVANSSIYIEGVNPVTGFPTASLNVRTHANINTLRANTGNIANIDFASGNITANGLLTTQHINVWGNVVSVNVTGNLWVANNVTMYNRLVAPNANIGVINVDNRITVQTLNVWGNVVSANVTGNLWVANEIIAFNRITAPNANIAKDVSGGYANIANIYFASGNITANGLLTTRSINVTQNIANVNVTGNLWVGYDTIIHGNLHVSGNVYLDALGYDDMFVEGNIISQNISTTNANITILSGQSNDKIFTTITSAIDSGIAFSIALG